MIPNSSRWTLPLRNNINFSFINNFLSGDNQSGPAHPVLPGEQQREQAAQRCQEECLRQGGSQAQRYERKVRAEKDLKDLSNELLINNLFKVHVKGHNICPESLEVIKYYGFFRQRNSLYTIKSNFPYI